MGGSQYRAAPVGGLTAGLHQERETQDHRGRPVRRGRRRLACRVCIRAACHAIAGPPGWPRNFVLVRRTTGEAGRRSSMRPHQGIQATPCNPCQQSGMGSLARAREPGGWKGADPQNGRLIRARRMRLSWRDSDPRHGFRARWFRQPGWFRPSVQPQKPGGVIGIAPPQRQQHRFL
jgi:hypothetical protein